MTAEDPLLELVDALELSTDRPTAALLRRIFWRAAASSPAALGETTAAYERLLLHASDAANAGRAVSRADIRRLAGPDEAQLVFWELVADPGGCGFSVADLPALRALRRQATAACRLDDERCAELRRLLSDGIPSLIFTIRRATVRYLRDRLAGFRVAWCSGSNAGVGPLRSTRGTVLDWFRSDAQAYALAPHHLITTDVAAEGLDLARLRRVVHYDLPWTPARMEQREGRSRRGAAAHLSTRIVIPVTLALEARLRMGSILDRKRALPAVVGIGAGTGSSWRWREELVTDLGDGPRLAGAAAIAGTEPGLIAGLQIVEMSGEQGIVVGRSMICTGTGNSWLSESSAAPALRWAASQPDAAAITLAERRAALGTLASGVRDLLRQHEAAAWWHRGDTAARTLLQRLYAMMQPASRARDRVRLAALERAIRFTGSGHTAGELMIIRSLAAASDVELLRQLPGLPAASAGTGLLAARLSGLIIIRDGELPFPARRDTFGAHGTLRNPAVRSRRHADQLGEADPGQLSPHPAGPRHSGADR